MNWPPDKRPILPYLRIMQDALTDRDFDAAIIASAFTLTARAGWGSVSVAAAAREAGLALDRARHRFASREALLMAFGRMADELALSDALESGPVRERLFDIVMRRFDALQQHREGVIALMRGLPAHPGTALLLAAATQGSMGWMLEGAGIPAQGFRGGLAAQALTGVWLYTLRAWMRDDSADLSVTMAALDRALSRVEQFAGMIDGAAGPAAEPQPKPFPEPVPGELTPGFPDLPREAPTEEAGEI